MNQFHGIFWGVFSESKILIFMENIQKKFFFVKLIYLISQNFWPGLFEKKLARRCGIFSGKIKKFIWIVVNFTFHRRGAVKLMRYLQQ